jgi:AmiR/NasT family two-component response regulator
MTAMRVLIVEDEFLLAMSLEDGIADAGHEVVGIATNRAEAVSKGLVAMPDLAFVDIHLADGPTGVETARALTDAGIRVVFTSGNVRRIPEDFAGAVGAIEKPYTMTGLGNALDWLARLVEGTTGGVKAPPSLKLAPGRGPGVNHGET